VSRSEGGGRGKEAWPDEEWDEGVPNVDVDAYGSEENAELLAGTKVQNTDARVGSKVRLLTQNVDMDVHGSEEIEEMLAGTKVQISTQLADSWYKSTHTDACSCGSVWE
jgi:hypothetical protein